MFYDVLATAIEGASRSQLDDYSRQVWKAHPQDADVGGRQYSQKLEAIQ